MKQTDNIALITCPFTGEVLTAVPALNPDVTVIHAQRADPEGNVQMWGITGVQKEALLAAQDLAGHGRGDRRAPGPGARPGDHPVAGRSPASRRSRTARTRRTRTATTTGTTTSTSTGTRSAATATAFTEWMGTHVLT